jgi:hypothetical protein
MMQAGNRPAGCEYCWKIEDMGVDAVSDRVYKSKIYPLESLNEAYNTPSQEDVNLRTLEIAFDRTCQFACSYCNPAFSSTWVNDIKRNGPYEQFWCLMGVTTLLTVTIVLNYTGLVKLIHTLKRSLSGGSQTSIKHSKS